MKRRSAMFRGSERDRWLLLLGVAIVGWTAVALSLWAGNPFRPRRPAAAPIRPIAAPPRVEPETAPAFAAIRDKQPMTFRENAAYATLLARARATPPAELARQSHRAFRKRAIHG